jgi:hypothetical protein
MPQQSYGPTGILTLTAPTGTGKTLAMLEFALCHVEANGLRRVVLVAPFLSMGLIAPDQSWILDNQVQAIISLSDGSQMSLNGLLTDASSTANQITVNYSVGCWGLLRTERIDIF